MRIVSYSRSLLFVLIMLLGMAVPSFAQIGISVNFGPPALPVYEQPICPGDGYIWTPGYWAYGDDDYYWVPGTWVEAPESGYLWTPGYWGWGGSAFLFHEGYWGPQVGFYGGINYGYGYGGRGYEGGRWDNGHFFYNRSVNNVNVSVIHNVYNTRVENVNSTRVSFNGGNGGVNVRASAQEEAAGRERHIGAVAAQNQHVQEARSNPELRASVNHGKPSIAATSRPGDFKGSGTVAAREAGGNYQPPARNGAANNATNNSRPATATAVHPKELPQTERPAAPNTGNAKVDQRYKQQQDKLYAKQEQDHQKLQQKQDQQHQRATQQKASDQRNQQLEQQHQQQTQQLEQKHTQQQQTMQQHQQQHAPPQQHEQPHPESHKP